MEETRRILRKAIFALLRSYQRFTSTAVLLAFPVSAAVLLSQGMVPPSSPAMATIQARLGALFVAAGLPASSELFSIFNLKLSQTIVSFVVTLPFSLTFHVLAKASVIQFVIGPSRRKDALPSLPCLRRLYLPLLQTHLCSAFVVLSANAAAFSVLFLAFNAAAALVFASEKLVLCLSAAGAIVYSVILAKSLVTCNLAIIAAGAENCGGFFAILRACVLLRGKGATALALALPTSLLMAAVEALFQLRVTRPYRATKELTPALIGEGLTIAYIYSLLLVLDIIVSCMFYQSCKTASHICACASGSPWEEDMECGGGGGGASGSSKSKLLEKP